MSNRRTETTLGGRVSDGRFAGGGLPPVGPQIDLRQTVKSYQSPSGALGVEE